MATVQYVKSCVLDGISTVGVCRELFCALALCHVNDTDVPLAVCNYGKLNVIAACGACVRSAAEDLDSGCLGLVAYGESVLNYKILTGYNRTAGITEHPSVCSVCLVCKGYVLTVGGQYALFNSAGVHGCVCKCVRLYEYVERICLYYGLILLLCGLNRLLLRSFYGLLVCCLYGLFGGRFNGYFRCLLTVILRRCLGVYRSSRLGLLFGFLSGRLFISRRLAGCQRQYHRNRQYDERKSHPDAVFHFGFLLKNFVIKRIYTVCQKDRPNLRDLFEKPYKFTLYTEQE